MQRSTGVDGSCFSQTIADAAVAAQGTAVAEMQRDYLAQRSREFQHGRMEMVKAGKSPYEALCKQLDQFPKGLVMNSIAAAEVADALAQELACGNEPLEQAFNVWCVTIMSNLRKVTSVSEPAYGFAPKERTRSQRDETTIRNLNAIIATKELTEGVLKERVARFQEQIISREDRIEDLERNNAALHRECNASTACMRAHMFHALKESSRHLERLDDIMKTTATGPQHDCFLAKKCEKCSMMMRWGGPECSGICHACTEEFISGMRSEEENQEPASKRIRSARDRDR